MFCSLYLKNKNKKQKKHFSSVAASKNHNAWQDSVSPVDGTYPRVMWRAANFKDGVQCNGDSLFHFSVEKGNKEKRLYYRG